MDLVQTSVKCGQAEITKNGIDPFFLNSSRVGLTECDFFYPVDTIAVGQAVPGGQLLRYSPGALIRWNISG